LTEVRIPWGTVIDGNAINNQGDIVGTASVAAGKIHGFVWTRKTEQSVELGTLGGSSSSAFGINDCGDAVGAATLKGDTLSHAAFFSHGKVTDLAPQGGPSIARSINNTGIAVGPYTVRGEFHPARYEAGKITDLTGLPGDAVAISGTAAIAGSSLGNEANNFLDQAFLIRRRTRADIKIDSFSSTDAEAINDFSDVAVQQGSGASDAVAPLLFQDEQLLNQPALADAWKTQVVMGINNLGELVGFSNLSSNPFVFYATLIRGQAIYTLDQLIDPEDPLKHLVKLTRAYGINDSGWIVSAGTDMRDSKAHVYLLKTKTPAIRWQRLAGGCPATQADGDSDDL
jgi:probable HAF family extracellular repeat protein